jgi:hypothetical protein
MTLQQGLAFGLVGLTIVAFIWGRWRYDLGAACDFLTPIGHQCNTMVMGPGGYRFADYPKLGAPLSLMVLLAGPLLISFFWPLA